VERPKLRDRLAECVNQTAIPRERVLQPVIVAPVT